MASDLQDREDRLIALVNVLGFATLDHLEDYVVLHGSARVVPLAAAEGSTLPLDETQTQTQHYSATKHAQRNEQRRVENARLKKELDGMTKELEWTRAELVEERAMAQELRRDKTRLLDTIDELTHRPERFQLDGVAHPIACPVDADAPVAGELSRCYDEIEDLDANIIQLEDELEKAWTKCDELADQLHEAQDQLQQGQKVERRLVEALEKLKKAEKMERRLNAVEGELTALQGRLALFVPTILDGQRAKIPGLPSFASLVPDSSASSLHRSSPAADTCSAFPISRASCQLRGPLLPLSSPPSKRQPLSESASTIRPPPLDFLAPLKPSLAPAPDAQPQPSTSSAAPASSAAVSGVSSTSTSAAGRLTSQQKQQLKLYPKLLFNYTTTRTYVASHQEFITLALPTVPVSSIGPSPTFLDLAQFPDYPPLLTEPEERKKLIETGELGRTYEEMEKKEVQLATKLPELQRWIKKLKDLAAKPLADTPVAKAEAEGKAQVKPEGDVELKPTAAAPEWTSKQPVRKRRKVARDGTPTVCGPSSSSAAASPSSALSARPRPSTARLFTPKDVIAPLPLTAPLSATTSATGTSRLFHSTSPLAAPPEPVLFGLKGSSSTKKRRWNLLSPSKRVPGSGTKTPRQSLVAQGDRGSPLKQTSELSVPVTDIQAPPKTTHRSSAVEGLGSESTYESEPDTIRTENGDFASPHQNQNKAPSSEARRRRSASRSPQKHKSPLRRIASVAPLPRPPLSFAYTAAAGKGSRPSAVVDDDDPFLARPFQSRSQEQGVVSPRSAAPSTRIPLQPSPNSRTTRASASKLTSPSHAQAHAHIPHRPNPSLSPSPSPSPNKGFYVPPSAQAGSCHPAYSSHGSDAHPAMSASPVSAKKKVNVEPTNSDKQDSFVEEWRTHPESNKKARKGKGEGKKRSSSERDGDVCEESVPRKTKESKTVTQEMRPEQDEEDVKLFLSQESTSELDRMPSDPDDEKGRRDYMRRVQAKRHARAEKVRAARAAAAGKTKALELNPERNDGVKHAYKEVVRKKAKRQSMLAEACGQCQAYYERARKTPPAGPCGHNNTNSNTISSKSNSPVLMRGFLEERAQQAQDRLQRDGRHRVQQRTVPDPPSFWEMGFPNTQQVENINREARQRKEEMRAWQEAQAQEQNGFYRFRDDA
ncbi:hypothetical protein JCM21900_002740 [Sporobolomyces salmonicolor]